VTTICVCLDFVFDLYGLLLVVQWDPDSLVFVIKNTRNKRANSMVSSLQCYIYSVKATYNFKEPTNRSHPVIHSILMTKGMVGHMVWHGTYFDMELVFTCLQRALTFVSAMQNINIHPSRKIYKWHLAPQNAETPRWWRLLMANGKKTRLQGYGT